MKARYRFSVFTPCYNSVEVLHRAFESLQKQTFRDFQWIVINDASTDSTASKIREYIELAEFPVTYFDLRINQMISASYNMAVQAADGELFVPLGHDDALLPESLEKLDLVWSRWGAKDIAGIWSLCEDQYGNTVGNEFAKEISVEDYFEVFFSYIQGMERLPCFRTEVLREYNFLSYDAFYVPESVVWGRIGLKYKLIFFNRVLRTYFMREAGRTSLTNTGRKKYARGTYYLYVTWLNEFIGRIRGHESFKLRAHFALVYYSILSEIDFRRVMEEVRSPTSRALAKAFYFPARAAHRITNKTVSA